MQTGTQTRTGVVVPKPGSIKEDWRQLFSNLIADEGLEVLVQHGPGLWVLMAKEFGGEAAEAYADLKANMADELSDLLWLDFGITKELKQSPSMLAASLTY